MIDKHHHAARGVMASGALDIIAHSEPAMTDPGHIPVLVDEILQLLSPQPGEVAVDCTAGRGGHSIEIARRIGPEGTIVAFDLDQANLDFAQRRIETVAPGPRFIPIHDSFTTVAEHLEAHQLQADILLADLGFASTQMDDPARGFSFTDEGPLDMRFDRSRPPGSPPTAADLIRTFSERELADIIYMYGEDPYSRKIARKLVREREIEPIETTARLARLVQEAYGPRARLSRMHPATRTFMALRIAVNDELGALRSLLDSITKAAERIHEGETWLKRGARIAIVSFHSLEDRMVKHAFADLAKRSLATRLTKKPVTCSEQEARSNPRARSAKLRAHRIEGANHER